MTAYARIETGRANRYLVQLCEHLDQMTRRDMHASHGHGGAPPAVQRVEWAADDAVITFDCGRCTMQATADTLRLRVDAADLGDRQRIQDMLSRRLQTIGRRDQLAVTWT